jgi:hypothetical protein
VEKCCRASQATDESISLSHCVLDNEGYTHSEYEILFAFLRQHCLRQRDPKLRYMYFVGLVLTGFMEQESEAT